MQVDLAVVGGGPAGLNAAIVAAADCWSVCVIDAEGGGGRLYKLDDVHDYPHAGSIVTGPGLADQLIEAAVGSGVEVVFERARSMSAAPAADGAGQCWRIDCAGEPIDADSVVVATGHADPVLGLPGEDVLRGRGLSYCASCDGSLFVGKRVAVYGSGTWAVDEALLLSKHAAHATLVCRAPALRSTRSRLQRLREAGVEVIEGAWPVGLGTNGAALVAVQLATASGTQRLDLDGLFPVDGSRPAVDAVPARAVAGDARRVVVDDVGGTPFPGLFAAGDVTRARAGFVSEAVAEGVRAGIAACAYLDRHQNRI